MDPSGGVGKRGLKRVAAAMSMSMMDLHLDLDLPPPPPPPSKRSKTTDDRPLGLGFPEFPQSLSSVPADQLMDLSGGGGRRRKRHVSPAMDLDLEPHPPSKRIKTGPGIDYSRVEVLLRSESILPILDEEFEEDILLLLEDDDDDDEESGCKMMINAAADHAAAAAGAGTGAGHNTINNKKRDREERDHPRPPLPTPMRFWRPIYRVVLPASRQRQGT